MKGERVPKPKLLDTNGHTGESLQRCAQRNKDARKKHAEAVEVDKQSTNSQQIVNK
jgi:hypothetical protein